MVNKLQGCTSLKPVFTTQNVNAEVKSYVKIDSFDEITHSFGPHDLVLLDLDDTIMDSEGMLGSKAWRDYIVKATKHDLQGNWHDILSLFIAQNYPVHAIEKTTTRFIEELQRKGVMVLGFTARERNLWYYTPCDDIDALTTTQLNSCGIDFTKTKITEPYQYLSKTPECFENVIFANTDTKGEYIPKLLKKPHMYPERVFFFDDKESQVTTVDEALSKLGINHQCFLYTAIDKKKELFDPLIANIQLYFLKKDDAILSDEDAQKIAERNPDKDAEFYLQTSLELFR